MTIRRRSSTPGGIGILVAVLLLTGIASAPSTPVASAQPAARAAAEIPPRLADELGAVLARFPDLTSTGRVGIAVAAADGTPVWSSNAGAELLPASTMKALTAGSVLATFGMGGTLTTTAAAAGPVGPDGTVAGNLVLHGVGDPTMTSDDYRRWVHPSRPSTAIEELADRVVAAGVVRVAGDIVGDGTMFGPSRTAAGWPPRYLADFDAHNLSALTIDAGRLVEVDAPPDGRVRIRIEQEQDPDLRTAVLFARALVDRGVQLSGRVRRAVFPTTALYPIARVSSPPMSEILSFMLQESDNHLADTLVRAAAVRRAGDGSWTAAGEGVRTALDDLGVASTGFVLSDGSGLSRTDRVSADLLVANDLAQFARWGTDWSDLLAVAGETGTLQGRLVGTPAEGRLFAKTGTLDDVRGLAGHVTGSGDTRYHVAMLVNDVDTDIRWQASVMGDELALVLADALDDCWRVRVVEEVVPASPAPTPHSPPPASPSASPEPRVVARRVTATPDAPGPALADADWDRRCR